MVLYQIHGLTDYFEHFELQSITLNV